MPDYDFRALSSDEFEGLVRDLLQRELGVRLESFARGRDNGIDLRHIDGGNVTVVQCKHFVRTGRDGLLRAMTTEKAKIDKLAPTRYIVATSVSLTPANKTSICDAVAPHLPNPGDVYGADDLNALLGKYPEIERIHFKLWLTSSGVLEKLLKSGLFAQSQDLRETLKERMRLYVPNQSFNRAQDVLREHRVCVIAGIPGIGKTMLAEMLMVSHIAEGYQPVVVSRDIDEASQLFHENQAQIFYYDDFLGQAGNSEKELNENEDSRIARFIARVERHRSKRFILTTREYILEDVKRRYDRLSDVDLMRKCVVELADYSRIIRARVFFNHLYFSRLPHEIGRQVIKERAYLEVVNHPNYSPRLIEKTIQFAERTGATAENFLPELRSTLADPRRLWGQAFATLSERRRDSLIVLVSMPQVAELADFKTAVEQFAFVNKRDGEVDVLRSLKELEGTFVRIEAFGDLRQVDFFNPAVRDLMLSILNDDAVRVRMLLGAAVLFEQPRTLLRLGTEEVRIEFDTKCRHPGIRETLQRNTGELLSAMIRTFESKVAQYYPLHRGNEGASKQRLAPTWDSTESRLAVICEATTALGETIALDWLREKLGDLAQTWKRGGGARQSMRSLLSALQKIPQLHAAAEAVASAAKGQISGSLETTEDVEALMELSGFEGGVLSADALEKVSAEFAGFVSNEIDSILMDVDDVDDIQRAIDDIEATAGRLDVYVDDEVDRLREYIKDLEERREREEDMYEDREPVEGPSGGGRSDEDAEMDALFSRLVDDGDC